MAINIKGIKRIVIAVADLEQARKRYEELFDIKSYAYGSEPEKGFHWLAFELGLGETTMEFISPLDGSAKKDSPIARFIKKRGEGIYMITLETDKNTRNTIEAMRQLGFAPTESVVYEGMPLNSGGGMAEEWHEHYIGPKETHGVLFALATITRRYPGVRNCNKGKIVPVPLDES